MNQPTSLKLKIPRGWFAAGDQIEKAIALLSDGAFKLFIHICLNARRDTGTLATSQNNLAKRLHKSRNSVSSYLKQMQEVGVCQFQMTQNPQAQGVIEITEPYWPYERTPSDPLLKEAAAYVAAVDKQLQARAYVDCKFSNADERLAREWFEQGVPLEQVEHAILLGCARKYVSWENGHDGSPIATLRYFESILKELSGQQVDNEYWNYVLSKLKRLEKLWLESKNNSATDPKSDNRSSPLSARRTGRQGASYI